MQGVCRNAILSAMVIQIPVYQLSVTPYFPSFLVSQHLFQHLFHRFLSSGRANSIVGQTIMIDGGTTLIKV